MNRLRSIRERKGLTLSQLAGKAGVPARVLADYEEGRTNIPLPHAKLLAKALWVQIEDLMPPAGSVPPQPSAPVPPSPPPVAPVQSPRPPAPAQTMAAAPQAAPVAQAPRVPEPPRSYPPAPARYDRPREVRDQREAPGFHGAPRGPEGPKHRGAGPAREPRPPKAPPAPPAPVTEGQMQELLHLAARLEISQEQLEERFGKPLNTLTRPEAKEWVKRLRGMADEIAPSAKVRFGRWPEAQQDREAIYLAEQREAAAPLTFKLFNGDEFTGPIVDFTPYTVTVRDQSSGQDVVLRKLAIAYYRGPAAVARAGNGLEHATEAAPVEAGVSSGRSGEPESPEIDNMDEDRGI